MPPGTGCGCQAGWQQLGPQRQHLPLYHQGRSGERRQDSCSCRPPGRSPCSPDRPPGGLGWGTCSVGPPPLTRCGPYLLPASCLPKRKQESEFLQQLTSLLLAAWKKAQPSPNSCDRRPGGSGRAGEWRSHTLGSPRLGFFLCNMEVSAPVSYPGLHRTVNPPGGRSKRALHLWAANRSKCFPCFVAQFREAMCLTQDHLAGRVPSYYWRGMCPTPARVTLQLAGPTDNREAHGSHTPLVHRPARPLLDTGSQGQPPGEARVSAERLVAVGAQWGWGLCPGRAPAHQGF